MMTRRHVLMNDALTHVREVLRQPPKVQTAYGALWHRVPILVLTNGLALTAGYIDAKAKGTSSLARAYALMRRHLIELLGGGEDVTMLAPLVGREACQATYMLATFTILDAGSFYKRFAESLLEVDAGAANRALDAEPGRE